MTIQSPIVLASGFFSQLFPGDTVPGTDTTAQASGNAALVLAGTALASGNAGISTGLTALASGNAGLVSASNKVPISGGYMTGQLFAASGVVVSGTLSRNGFNVVTVGDVETVTSTMIASGTIIDADVNISGAINATKLNFLQAGTSAVARTVDSKLKDIVSVLDFGADLTGTADSAAAFTAALVASNQVYIPPGTYRINTTITLSSGKSLVGAGWGTTSINSYAAASPCFQTTPGTLCDVAQIKGFTVVAKSSATVIFDLSTARNSVFDSLQAVMNERTGGGSCRGFYFNKTTSAVANYYNVLSNSYSFDTGATASTSTALEIGRTGDGANSNYFNNVVLFGSNRGLVMASTVGCVFNKIQIMNCVFEALLLSSSSMNFFQLYIEATAAQGTIDANSINNTFYIYPDGGSSVLNIANSSCFVQTIETSYAPAISLSPITINDSATYTWTGTSTKNFGKLTFQGVEGSALVSITVSGLTATAGGGAGTRMFTITYVNSTNPVVTAITGASTTVGQLTDITTTASTSGSYGVVTFTLTANATLQNGYRVSTSIVHTSHTGTINSPIAATLWERL